MGTDSDQDEGERPDEHDAVNGQNERNPEVGDEEALADAAGNREGDDGGLGGGAERGGGEDGGGGEEREQGEVEDEAAELEEEEFGPLGGDVVRRSRWGGVDLGESVDGH